MHKLLDAFADGINYYLYRHPETRPLVLTHFEPWYALMFTDGSVSATSTGGIRPEEIKDFYSGDHRVAGGGVAEPDDRETGSNGFAIAPARTAGGNALLYINPHVPYYFRMEVQLGSEEGLNAYGAVTWGQFFIYQGFNAHCGWMHTSSYADVADCYAEKTSRQGEGWVYEYEGQLKPVKSRPFTIRYKKDGEMQSLPVTGYYTHHGPVMAIRDGKWLSLKEYNRSLNALLEAWQITRANTFAEYKTAMDIRANTTNNTVYADDQGNIAYWHGNFMPRRDGSYNWSLPVDGSVAATEW
jgi:acyl-homoserine-lactone acylase